MCQDTPLYKRGGILHSILHSSSAVPCAPALCTLHSRTCADFALGRAVGFRGGAVRRLGAFGRVVRPGFASVRPCVCGRAGDGSLAVRKVCTTFCLASAPRACGRVLASVLASVRPSARVDQGRDSLRHCENLVKHSAQVAHLALRLLPRVGILPTPRFFSLLFIRSALALSLAGARIARGRGRLWGATGRVGVRVARNARGAPRLQTRFYGGLWRVARVGVWLLVRFVPARSGGFLAGLWGRRPWGRE